MQFVESKLTPGEGRVFQDGKFVDSWFDCNHCRDEGRPCRFRKSDVMTVYRSGERVYSQTYGGPLYHIVSDGGSKTGVVIGHLCERHRLMAIAATPPVKKAVGNKLLQQRVEEVLSRGKK
jgi:hypothetical protein